MKIEKITITNFRNYYGSHNFDLGNKIIILFGNNGNGKSSFFDAIEWCLTGYINRFIDKDKQAIANKRILLGQECSVELYFSNLCLRRSFIKNEEGFGKETIALYEINRNKEQQKITSGIDNVDLALRKIFSQRGRQFENINYKIGEIIKKAYILSQDQVADFVIRDKPEERYKALASIMGFNKVVNIRKNLAVSKKILDDIHEEYVKNIVSTEKDISLKEDKKKKVDSNILIRYQKNFNTTLSENKITDINSNLNRELFSIEKELEFLNKINNEGVYSVRDINELIRRKKGEIIQSEKELNEMIIQNGNIDSYIKKLEGEYSELQKNRKTEKLIKHHQSNIENNENKLLDLGLKAYTFESVKDKINKMQQEEREYYYAYSFKREYDSAKEFLLQYPEIFHKETALLSEREKDLRISLDKEKEVTDSLLNEGGNAALSSLLQNIEQISSYLELYNTEGICPVCSSEVGEGLNDVVRENIDKLLLEIDKQKSSLNTMLRKKKIHSDNIIELQNIIQKQKYKIEDLEKKMDISKKTVVNVENSPLFGSIFEYNLQYIESHNKKIKIELEKLNLALNYCSEIDRSMNYLKQYSASKDMVINGDYYEKLKEVLEIEKEGLSKLNNSISERRRYITETEQEIFSYNNFLQELNLMDNKYNTEIVSELYVIIQNRIGEVHSLFVLLNKASEFLDNSKYNEEIEMEINQLKKELLQLEKKRIDILQKNEALLSVLNKIDKQFGEGTADFLNAHETAIQKYFRYLNPRPSEFDKLYFDIQDNEKLSIKIIDKYYDEYTVNANMALSSGQLNVLALAIFIATNESQNFSYFDFIAIDDPIQNMDDVNRFSICDVLSSLNKQLIFSTHDQEFVTLFLKKNEHKKKDITLYFLNADEQEYKMLT